MKLYFNENSCAKIPLLVAMELQINLELVDVDLKNNTIPDGSSFSLINEKGYVPALELEDGTLLIEVTAICVYLASLRPAVGMMPEENEISYMKALEWLNYLATEIHQGFYPRFASIFGVDVGQGWLDFTEQSLMRHFVIINKSLAGKSYLLGEKLTCPDIYLFVTIGWANLFKIDLSNLINIQNFYEKLSERKSIKSFM